MPVKVKADFPAIQWFQALQEFMNSNRDKYVKLGFTDCRGIYRILADGLLKKNRSFGAVYDVYECTEIRELDDNDLQSFDPDWILEASYSDWKEMIENIKENGRADSDHTLNRLSLLQHPFKIYGTDQLRVDVFFRQQATFQEFFDDSVNIDTRFPA